MDDKQWFLYVVDHHEGPFTAHEIKERVKNGEAKSSSFVWRDGYADWVMMSDVTEFGVQADSGAKGDAHGPATFVTSPSAAQPMPSRGSVSLDSGSVAKDAAVWCLKSKNSFSGPFTMEQLSRMLASGEIQATDAVWREGWTSFSQVASLVSEQKGAKKGSVAVGTSVRKARNYRPLVMVALLAMLVAGGYYAHISGVLKIPTGLSMPSMPDFGMLAEVARPIEKYIPANILEKIGFGPRLPENLKASDAEKIKAAIKAGQTAFAVEVGDEMNPSIVIGSKKSDGTILDVRVSSIPGATLSLIPYQAVQSATISKNVGRTSNFMFDRTKPLPKGEYNIQITDSSTKQALVTEKVFLGGIRDRGFDERIADFNAKIKEKRNLEVLELRQVSATLESIANESAVKFFALAKMPNSPKRKKAWADYANLYQKISQQLEQIVQKKDVLNRESYALLAESFGLATNLHAAETDFLEKGGAIDEVRALAAKTLESLNQLKNKVATDEKEI